MSIGFQRLYQKNYFFIDVYSQNEVKQKSFLRMESSKSVLFHLVRLRQHGRFGLGLEEEESCWLSWSGNDRLKRVYFWDLLVDRISNSTHFLDFFAWNTLMNILLS
jgi:hypothetical protein